MRFDNIDSIVNEGFVTVEELMRSCAQVPKKKGIYLVLYTKEGPPHFVNPGTGGFFKGRNPNESIDLLKEKWIDNTIVIYIGQAGGVKVGKPSDETLQTRITRFMSFGRTNKVAHWGGRYIWQIRNHKGLVLCWKTCDDKATDPKQIEGKMLREFKRGHEGRLPFANLQE